VDGATQACDLPLQQLLSIDTFSNSLSASCYLHATSSWTAKTLDRPRKPNMLDAVLSRAAGLVQDPASAHIHAQN
jgi:hypothetical protein